MIGSQVSHYRLVRKLGSGTYGEVYEGVHVHDDELRVAVKVVSPALAQDARFLDALKRECRQLDKFRHPNIVTFRELVVQGDQVAMVLELLRGQDLHDRLAGWPLPVDTAVSVLEAMLDGLGYAHAAGVLHRNLKPRNVYWCDDGRIVILDFGIGRAADGAQAATLPHTASALDYLAPERVSGSGGTASSDVYAVGLVAWEMLTGLAAAPHGDAARKRMWHTVEGVGDAAQVAPTLRCPPWLADVIATLAAKDPAQRPANGQAALALLQKMVKQWPFFKTLLSNMDMVLAKSDLALASRYSELVTDAKLRKRIFASIEAEWHRTAHAISLLTGDKHRLANNPALARSIRHRFPYIDPLHHLQVELIRRYREGKADERVQRGIHMSINGIAAGLRNTG